MRNFLCPLSLLVLGLAWSDHGGLAALKGYRTDQINYLPETGATSAQIAEALLTYGGRCGPSNHHQFSAELKTLTNGDIDLATLGTVNVNIMGSGATVDYFEDIIPNLDSLSIPNADEFAKLKNPTRVLKSLNNQAWDIMEELFPKPPAPMGGAFFSSFNHSQDLASFRNPDGTLSINITRPALEADVAEQAQYNPGLKVGDPTAEILNLKVNGDRTTLMKPAGMVIREGHLPGLGSEFITQKQAELERILTQKNELETYLAVINAHKQITDGLDASLAKTKASRDDIARLINERLIDGAQACVLRKKDVAPAAVPAPGVPAAAPKAP